MDDLTDPMGEPCGMCGEPIGDHTVRDWSVHVSAPTLDLPVEEIPDGPIPVDVPAAMTDHLIVKSMVADGGMFNRMKIGAVQFEFGTGHLGRPIEMIDPIVFVGSPEILRKTGVMVRNICNQAANKAER